MGKFKIKVSSKDGINTHVKVKGNNTDLLAGLSTLVMDLMTEADFEEDYILDAVKHGIKQAHMIYESKHIVNKL